MDIPSEINKLIDSSLKIIAIVDSGDIPKAISFAKDRDLAIKELFQTKNHYRLALYPDQLKYLSSLNSQIVEIVEIEKNKSMQLLTDSKTAKTANVAYLNHSY